MSEIELMKIAVAWSQFANIIGTCASGELWYLASSLNLSHEDCEKIREYIYEIE